MISFELPGKPMAKARPRFTREGRAFTPAKTKDDEGFIRFQAAQAMTGKDVLRGAVQARVLVEVEPPQTWSKKKRNLALTNDLFPTVKPDMDNVIKAIFDACNGVVFVDDKQVVQLTMAKRYGERDVTTVSFEEITA